MIRIKRLFKSFVYAFRGLARVFRDEQNLRVQGVAAILVMILGFYYKIDRIEWCFLVFAIGLVMLMEVLNSAVERVTDVLKPRINNYVKEIKDIMAAVVMMSAILSVIIGVIIFFPYIFTK